MTQIHTRRDSPHSFIGTVWRTQNVEDGIYLATPDGSWDLIVLIQKDGSKSMMVTGQATKPMNVPYQAGTSSVVISFAPGVYLPSLPGDSLVDSFIMLENSDTDHFLIDGYGFAFPTFENAETLVERMAAIGLLAIDSVVQSVQDGSPKALSRRATQRHFSKSTGITQKDFEQIERAKEAIRELRRGKKASAVAADMGFVDQSHLTKSLKKIMGVTPLDVGDVHKL
ncbi:MAG TPA: helix-turn-helix domain-containing protein [Candidatus Saccharimonadales bacterium]|nr:helix-turn-helix domain-containing protein [Candidatus Saccharimonadales bacterium]